jgi:hypothetical protein
LYSLRTIFSDSCLLVEHVLAEHAFVQAGRRDRGHVVQLARVDGTGELHRVARALDVGPHLAFFIGRQVIYRGQVVEVIDTALERLDVLG